MEQINAKPFLKWAGGKAKLISELEDRYPEELIKGEINTYIEPFIGGGAVFFDIASKYNFERVIINDINKELILTYKVIKNYVDEIINNLNKYQEEYNYLNKLVEKEKYYYKIREEFNNGKGNVNYEEICSKEIEHAAFMIFLNKSCFNGLYRENKKGGFNVPFGKKEKINTYEEENLRAVNKLLQKTIILNGDFEKVEEYIDSKTFIYLDPPYRPLKGKGSFKDYSKEEFNDDTQVRLARFYKKISQYGAKVIESNSDPKNSDEEDMFFDELYKEFKIDRINAARNINSKGNGRGKISEILIISY
jgi:DNA adenine methylase